MKIHDKLNLDIYECVMNIDEFKKLMKSSHKTFHAYMMNWIYS